MRTITIAFLAAPFCLLAADQPVMENPQVASSKGIFEYMKGTVLRSAEKMPEEKYSYKPIDGVRTYGEVLAHIADAQYEFCGAVKEGKPVMKGIEQSAKTKADITGALNDAFAYCEGVYSGLTDASSAALVPFMGMKLTKLALLSLNTAHLDEHYGNLVTYMRMNAIVPPSSEPRK
jgi:uncharacterized damage-inducible protein DinB